jgi:outer membrane biosynthesis protein TonB
VTAIRIRRDGARGERQENSIRWRLIQTTSGFMQAAKFATILVSIIGSAALPALAEPVTITRLTGSVKITSNEKRIDARAGTTTETPLRITTGKDGSLRLEQASSALDIGPNTVIVLPGASAATGTTEKILQQIGRVLYSVKPRKTRPFVVETPYLVSVVKGTTFSVAVEDDSAAIALLEGSVAVSGPGSDEEVLLEPNQTATRKSGSAAITVTAVESAPPPISPQANTNHLPMQVAEPLADALSTSRSVVDRDLNEITAGYAGRGSAPPPTTPIVPPPKQPAPEPTPDAPSPEGPPKEPAPQPEPEPESQPQPVPQPQPEPEPEPVPGDDEEDDGNNGDGNDEDGEDDSQQGDDDDD